MKLFDEVPDRVGQTSIVSLMASMRSAASLCGAVGAATEPTHRPRPLWVSRGDVALVRGRDGLRDSRWLAASTAATDVRVAEVGHAGPVPGVPVAPMLLSATRVGLGLETPALMSRATNGVGMRPPAALFLDGRGPRSWQDR